MYDYILAQNSSELSERDEVNGFLVFAFERREAEHVLVALPRSQQAVSHGGSCSQVESLSCT